MFRVKLVFVYIFFPEIKDLDVVSYLVRYSLIIII